MENIGEKQIVIFGCGAKGQILLRILREKGYQKIIFFDNDKQKQGQMGEEFEIKAPQKLDVEAIYIVAINDKFVAENVVSQLEKQMIDRTDIYYFNDTIYQDYKKTLSKDEIENEIERICWNKFGKDFNIREPKTFNEIINWEKTHVNDPRRTILADKVLVRDWVADKIGEKYLNEIYSIFDTEDEIDFDKLPPQYVLKLNNGSGRNIIVQDTQEVDKDEIISQLHMWRTNNFAYQTFEMHYKDIQPKIICEKFLDGVAEALYDYNVYCFHGEPKYIWCIKGSHRLGCQATFYNKDWERQNFSYGYPLDLVPAPRPEKLEEMLTLSRRLSSGFEHVRVDWYILASGELKFGEMSFSSWSGLEKFVPEEYDLEFGQFIRKER